MNGLPWKARASISFLFTIFQERLVSSMSRDEMEKAASPAEEVKSHHPFKVSKSLDRLVYKGVSRVFFPGFPVSVSPGFPGKLPFFSSHINLALKRNILYFFVFSLIYKVTYIFGK
jgi:hypothetical protein